MIDLLMPLFAGALVLAAVFRAMPRAQPVRCVVKRRNSDASQRVRRRW